MRLALIGYGAMGQLIAQQARAANDDIGETFTSKEAELSIEEMAKLLGGHDVAMASRSRPPSRCRRSGPWPPW